MNHDQRLKILLKEFLREFFTLFFPDWAGVLDFRKITWLEQELFPDPPDGARRAADLVAQVRTKVPLRTSLTAMAQHFLVLIHIEVEANNPVSVMRERMHEYYSGFRTKLRLPVLPIVVYVNVGLDGIGTDQFTELIAAESGTPSLETLVFKYLYVGLPALEAAKYVESDNVLAAGLSSLMKTPRGELVAMKAKALRQIARRCHNERQRFLLGECVEVYKPLNAKQDVELKELFKEPEYQETQKMIATTFQKGREEGLELGTRRTLKQLLEGRFGTLTKRVSDVVDSWPEKSLPKLIQLTSKVGSLDELIKASKQH